MSMYGQENENEEDIDFHEYVANIESSLKISTDGDEDVEGGQCSIMFKGENFFADMSINTLDGACGICLLSHIQATNDQKNLGEVCRVLTLIAEECTYTRLMATLNYYQSHLKDAFLKDGWRAVDSFKSRRTSNNCTIYVKDI